MGLEGSWIILTIIINRALPIVIQNLRRLPVQSTQTSTNIQLRMVRSGRPTLSVGPIPHSAAKRMHRITLENSSKRAHPARQARDASNPILMCLF